MRPPDAGRPRRRAGVRGRRGAGRALGAPGVAALLVAILLPGLPGDGAAQVVRERPVPLDTAGAVQEIDAELRQALGLFPEVEGFRSARLFRISDGGYVLEITFRDVEGLVRERRALSATEAADLRTLVSTGLEGRDPAAYSTDGRAGLVLTSSALGLAYYGWAVPAAMDLEDRGAVAAYLLTAGGSFLLPYRLTRDRPVSRSQRNAAAWGATRGILYGLVLGDALTGGEEDDDHLDDADDRVSLALGMATSVIGGALGYGYGGRPGADEGSVAFLATVGDFALAWGFGTSAALGLYEGELDCFGDSCVGDDFQRRPAGHLTSLALGAAGTWAAGRWPSAHDHTLGNTRALRSFGLLGAQAVLPLAWAAFEDRDNGERALVASLVAGSMAGMWTGDRILRDRRLSSGGGLLVLAGHVAGGLGALGVTYLLDGSDSEHEVLYMTTSALGSLAGSWLTLGAVGDGGGRSGSADAPDDRSDRGSGLRVDVRPLSLGLLSLVAPHPERRTDVPWLTLRFD